MGVHLKPERVFTLGQNTQSVQRSLKKANLNLYIETAEDGEEGLSIVKGIHPTKKLNKPFLVLLDLNMPRMNGFEFLEKIRSEPQLKSMVIFVLTTSNADSDLNRAYNENIAGYMVKSCVGPQFKNLVSLLDTYNQSIQLP